MPSFRECGAAQALTVSVIVIQPAQYFSTSPVYFCKKNLVQVVVSTRGGTQNKFHMEVNPYCWGAGGRGGGRELRYSVSRQFDNSVALSERAPCTSSPFQVQTIPQVSSRVPTQYKIVWHNTREGLLGGFGEDCIVSSVCCMYAVESSLGSSLSDPFLFLLFWSIAAMQKYIYRLSLHMRIQRALLLGSLQ